jgi:hypothetical protein
MATKPIGEQEIREVVKVTRELSAQEKKAALSLPAMPESQEFNASNEEVIKTAESSNLTFRVWE